MSKKVTNSTNEKHTNEVVTDYLTHDILREIVAELEQTKTRLLNEIDVLKAQLQQKKDDQADIYFFLNKKCDENYETIASLEEQILREQNDREEAERISEKKIDNLMNRVAADDARYLAKIKDLEDKILSLKEYSTHREEQKLLNESLHTTLEFEREQFASTKDEMERRLMQDRERLRKEIEHKSDLLKAEVDSRVKDKLSKKTKRIFMMNSAIKKELANQVMSTSFLVIKHSRSVH
jgi:uncharacterized small protein (DUF1192 family)